MPRRAPPTTIHELHARAKRNGTTPTNDDGKAGVELCGEELARGGKCKRPADDCPYHAERDL